MDASQFNPPVPSIAVIRSRMSVGSETHLSSRWPRVGPGELARSGDRNRQLFNAQPPSPLQNSVCALLRERPAGHLSHEVAKCISPGRKSGDANQNAVPSRNATTGDGGRHGDAGWQLPSDGGHGLLTIIALFASCRRVATFDRFVACNPGLASRCRSQLGCLLLCASTRHGNLCALGGVRVRSCWVGRSWVDAGEKGRLA